MKRITIYLSIVIAILFTVSIVLNKFEFIKPSLLGLSNVEVLEINKDTVSIDVEVSLLNNFFWDVDINEIRVDIFCKNDTIGKVSSNSNSILKGNDTSKIILPAKFNTVKLAELLEKNSDSIKLKLKGFISAKILFFEKNINVDEDLNIELKSSILKAIEKLSSDSKSADKMIEIKSAKLIELGLKHSKVLIEFTLKNPYDVPIKLISYPSEIYINENFSGSGNLKKEIELKLGGELSEGEFEFEIENLKGLKGVLKTIFTSKMTYKTIGDLHFSILGFKIKIPYSSTGDLVKL